VRDVAVLYWGLARWNAGKAYRNDGRVGGLVGIRGVRLGSAQESYAVFAHHLDAGARSATGHDPRHYTDEGRLSLAGHRRGVGAFRRLRICSLQDRKNVV